jgi:hypothetical protein
MLDLEQTRARAAMLSDNSTTTVTGSWLRQVIRELSAARETQPLHFKQPEPSHVIGIDLAGPSGSFTAFTAVRKHNEQARRSIP